MVQQPGLPTESNRPKFDALGSDLCMIGFERPNESDFHGGNGQTLRMDAKPNSLVNAAIFRICRGMNCRRDASFESEAELEGVDGPGWETHRRVVIVANQ